MLFGRSVRASERTEEADPGSTRTSWSYFCPAYVTSPTTETPSETEWGVNILLPNARWRTAFDCQVMRRPTVAGVTMETDEKRRPGLFQTIIRRSIPLVIAYCISLYPPPSLFYCPFPPSSSSLSFFLSFYSLFIFLSSSGFPFLSIFTSVSIPSFIFLIPFAMQPSILLFSLISCSPLLQAYFLLWFSTHLSTHFSPYRPAISLLFSSPSLFLFLSLSFSLISFSLSSRSLSFSGTAVRKLFPRIKIL